MLFIKSLAAVGFLATTVLADGAAIVASLNKIDGDTAALNTSVVTWDGSLLGAFPILEDSATLLGDLNDGTKTAQNSANLTTDEAITVYTAVQGLSKDVNITLTNVIAARPKFDKILITGIVKVDLKATKSATDKYAAAIVAKVPANLQSIANSVVAGIDASFDQAIAALS